MVVRDKAGNTFAMPFAYTAALDENAAKQIYAVVRQAVTDANRDLICGVAAMIAQAFTPATPNLVESQENPDQLCAANLATGMCNVRRADHADAGHPFEPGALSADPDGIPSLEIEPPPEEVPSA